MIKHFSNYQTDDDLIQFAFLAVLSRRKQYDPTYSAYSYIYTICRNEIGNNIAKLSRVVPVDTLNRVRGAITTMDDSELPIEVAKFKDVLLGISEVNYVRISKKDALNLIIFLRLNENKVKTELPDYIPDSKATRVLYKLLQEIFYEPIHE